MLRTPPLPVPPVVRAAAAPDAEAVADLWLRSFAAALPGVRRAHSDDDVRVWVRDVLVPGGGTLVAEVGDVVVGMLVLAPGWIDKLYVDPGWQGRGVGSRLLGHAQCRQPAGLQLWTFRVNVGAQRFYERHGFVAVERTDGSANEEREPDVRYVWPG